MSESPPIKPGLPTGTILAFLEDVFGQPVQDLQGVQGGEVAQAFSFSLPAESGPGYILRVNPPMAVGFDKEAYIYRSLASPSLPIPRVLQVGRLEGLAYAITEKRPGQNLLQLPRPEYLALLPSLVHTLDAIHQISVKETSGYGIFDGNGVAPQSSWREHLALAGSEEPGDEFLGGWHTLFDHSFLDRDTFENIYQKMLGLAAYSPTERFLVHGDYGFGNILAEEGRITAVLDWLSARYGDFLYDIAWLDFWAPQDGWGTRFEQHYQAAGRMVPNYRQRILACQGYIALNAMKFYAKANLRPSYDFVITRITSLYHESGL